jgi:hypothetical protein
MSDLDAYAELVEVAPPRIFGIPAAHAPVVAVLRRGPSDWCHLGAWDYAVDSYESGAWVHGVIYPQRCDLSPDGRWLSYFVLKKASDWPAGNAYVAISRLPWLTALAAWGIGSTWTRGAHFVADTDVWEWEDPDVGDPSPCRQRYGLARTRPESFAVERRRGWTETPDAPPRRSDDLWDEGREITMRKPSPSDGTLLLASGWYAAHRAFDPERYGGPVYAVDSDNGQRLLDGVVWADWSRDGDLLVATDDGRIQRRSPDGRDVAWDHDLSTLEPDPQPPPPEASAW